MKKQDSEYKRKIVENFNVDQFFENKAMNKKVKI